jgi:NAD-dependent deacetylase
MQTAKQIRISTTDRIFVLTGTGISAESGLATFRAADGLWAGYRLEDVCTPEAWERDPAQVWKFYSARRTAAEAAKPNPAHFALAELEASLGERYFLCTQNVDGLHELAGSRRLVHMHGLLNQSRCEDACGEAPVEDHALYESLADVGRCKCGARLRPHIVFFGETPLELPRIQDQIEAATVMLVVGTSGSVYPAANFVNWARMNKARTIYVGPEAPLNANSFTIVVDGKAGETLPGLFIVD